RAARARHSSSLITTVSLYQKDGSLTPRGQSPQYRCSRQGSPWLWYPFVSQNPGSSAPCKRRPRTHLALFQKYRCGTSRRAGPPCSGSSGSPSYSYAIHALPPRRSSSGTFVVYPPSQKARTNAPLVSTSSSSVSTDAPAHVVSSFDHLVTQWM